MMGPAVYRLVSFNWALYITYVISKQKFPYKKVLWLVFDSDIYMREFGIKKNVRFLFNIKLYFFIKKIIQKSNKFEL